MACHSNLHARCSAIYTCLRSPTSNTAMCKTAGFRLVAPATARCSRWSTFGPRPIRRPR
jgi:hypothetical protein